MDAITTPALARIVPPKTRKSTIEIIRGIIRNPIENWPIETYEEPFVWAKLFGKNLVMVSDPELIKGILVDHADAFEKALSMRRSLGPSLGDSILLAEGARWRWQRRASAPSFRHERILSFFPAMHKAAEVARDKMLAQSGSEVSMAHEMMHVTFDIIVDTMLSGAAGLDVDRVEQSITDSISATTWSLLLTLTGLPKWTPHPNKRIAARGRNYLKGEFLRIAKERRANPSDRNDLLSLLVSATDAETGTAMNDQDLADNIFTFIAAGHETTALALTWTFYLLSQHPSIEERVLAEIADVTNGESLKQDDVDKLAYTKQVLMEAMRLYPPAAMVVRTALRDIELPGLTIPKGTPVNVPIYATQRHKRIWSSPDTFDPDNFTQEAIKSRHRYSYLPFGAGPRICIGMSFALTEAAIILATILPAVHATLRPGYVPHPQLRVTLRPMGGMPMTIERRA
jgi:cytochrome P450